MDNIIIINPFLFLRIFLVDIDFVADIFEVNFDIKELTLLIFLSVPKVFLMASIGEILLIFKYVKKLIISIVSIIHPIARKITLSGITKGVTLTSPSN